MVTSTTGPPPCELTHLFSEALLSHTRQSLFSPLHGEFPCYPTQTSLSMLGHPLAQMSLLSFDSDNPLNRCYCRPSHAFLSFLTGLWFLKPVYRSCSVLPLHVDCLTEIQPIHPELSILLRKEMKRKSRKWQHGGQLYWSTWWFYNS